MAFRRNGKPIRNMGAVPFVLAFIAVIGVQAVVDNEMTDKQYDHSELMAETKLTNPEFGMKVFVLYFDKQNPKPILVPAVITGISTMLDNTVEINVRYLDGSTVNNRVYLENVFERDDTVSYANWALDGFDPRTMHANGQTRVIAGSSSRPFVSRSSMGAVFRGGAAKGTSSGGAAAKGTSSGGGSSKGTSSGGGASKGTSSGGGAAKKRKMTHAKTAKQPMADDVQGTIFDGMDLSTAIDEIKLHGSWLLEKELKLNKAKEQNANLCAERDVAVERARQSDLRATAAEERAAAAEERATAAEQRVTAAEERATAAEERATAAIQQQMETAEAGATRATRASRERASPPTDVLSHGACRD